MKIVKDPPVDLARAVYGPKFEKRTPHDPNQVLSDILEKFIALERENRALREQIGERLQARSATPGTQTTPADFDETAARASLTLLKRIWGLDA